MQCRPAWVVDNPEVGSVGVGLSSRNFTARVRTEGMRGRGDSVGKSLEVGNWCVVRLGSLSASVGWRLEGIGPGSKGREARVVAGL